MGKEINYVKFNGEVYAIVIPSDYSPSGVDFITPNDYSIQLACMNRPKGDKAQEHIHLNIKREINNTQEVLVFRKGKAFVDIYTQEKKYLGSENVRAGDIIMFVQGGHGVRFEEDTDVIEIKQGPYFDIEEKQKFNREDIE